MNPTFGTSVTIALLAMTPIALLLFAALKPRRALIATMVVGWLFLPQAGIGLPGLPNLTKVSAISWNALLCVLVFDSRRLASFRPTLWDMPMLAFVLSPIASSISNGLGVWDGLSTAFDTATWAGMPYLLGRVYFTDLESFTDLALGIFVGGLVYVPFCLWEIRMSPHLHNTVYGFRPTRMVHALRYGGYKPSVFMDGGLALSMWMCAATLCGAWLATRRKRLFGMPMTWLVVGMVATTILCKSLGAIALMFVGLGLLVLTRYVRTAVPLYALMLFVPTYMAVRATNQVTADDVMARVAPYVDESRAGSLRVRLVNEDMIAERALQRPMLGWGGWKRAHVVEETTGRQLTVTDGMWIIVFGQRGLVGLAAFTLTMVLPVWLFLRRHPARTWRDPRVVACASLAMVTVLFSIDCLLNAKLNPMIVLSWGALSSAPALAAGLAIARARNRSARAPLREHLAPESV